MTSTDQTEPTHQATDRSSGRRGSAGVSDEIRGEVGRRTVLRGAAVGGLALPLLAACGGGDEAATGSEGSGASAESSPTESSSGGGAAAGAATVAVADVPVGGGAILKEQKLVVTQPAKGQFKAFSAVCTHQGCLVSEITGEEIICRCHGSQFSITDGSPTSGPADEPLGAKTATVKGDQVSIT